MFYINIKINKYKNYKIKSYFDNSMESTIFWGGFVEIIDEEHHIWKPITVFR